MTGTPGAGAGPIRLASEFRARAEIDQSTRARHDARFRADVDTGIRLAASVPDRLRETMARIRAGESVGNPYLDLWNESHQYPKGDRWGTTLDGSPWDRADAMTVGCIVRRACTRPFGWAVPDGEALDVIARWSPEGVVEVGAGTGYWARMLLDRGVDVRPYDLHPFGCRCAADEEPVAHQLDDGSVVYAACSTDHPKTSRWANVVRAGVEAAAWHPRRTLLLVWPPYAESMAALALLRYWAAGGETLAYVGEGSGGCTGDDRFHALLGDPWWYDEDEDEGPPPGALFDLVEDVAVPSWAGIHDHLYVYRRRHPVERPAGQLALPRGAR